MPGILDKLLRAGEGKILRRLKKLKDQVNALEDDYVDLTDEELRGLTQEYKERYEDGESLDDLLPEAFATVREAAKRTLGQRPFDVQIMGAAALHLGNIAEMKTGEGKTLTGSLAVYLNALAGKGAHVITTNDYLARRDAQNLGRIFHFLGLEVGVVGPQMTPDARRKAYQADITYGTNNEFGFDYLRDNMKYDFSQYVQREHNFAIVDEVDSILIDEARTPLIISGPAEESTDLYYEVDRIIPRLKPGAKTKGDAKAEEREALEATGLTLEAFTAGKRSPEGTRRPLRVPLKNPLIDSGIDGSHPAFGGRVKRSFDFRNFRKIVSLSNSKQVVRNINIAALKNDPTWAMLKDPPEDPDTDLKRLADDARNRGPIHWELVEKFVEIKPESKPPTNHGTHVAGIIGASKESAKTAAGSPEGIRWLSSSCARRSLAWVAMSSASSTSTEPADSGLIRE